MILGSDLMQQADKRKAERVPMYLPVEVSTFSIPSFARANMQDLTPHGIAVQTELAPHAYDEVEVSLHIPYEISLEKKVTVRFRGEIVRVMNGNIDGRRGFAAILHPLSRRNYS